MVNHNGDGLERKLEPHYANMPMEYSSIFHGCKNNNFQMKNCDLFLIFAQNIDYGYTLETSTHDVYPCKPQFHYIKVGCKGVFITWTCLHDVMLWHFMYINKKINLKNHCFF